jgi:periplasmic mercuric ion binding protein
MKKIVLSLTGLFLLGILTVFSMSKTEKFEVKGNCGMCEKTIEAAAMSVEGVQSADWNRKTKIMTLTFDESKTGLDKVQKAIAKSGYDTPLHRADDAVYNKLHSCCKYERAKADNKQKKAPAKGHQH